VQKTDIHIDLHLYVALVLINIEHGFLVLGKLCHKPAQKGG
jgi:hypothetical protein